MKKAKKSSQSLPICCFCGGSHNTQFAIFNPRFQPFGTACVECEASMPAGITPPTSGTLAERLNGCVPEFQAKIKALADLAQLPALAVFAYWRKYSDACTSGDQSPVLGEFTDWYADKLGGNREALQLAIQDEAIATA